MHGDLLALHAHARPPKPTPKEKDGWVGEETRGKLEEGGTPADIIMMEQAHLKGEPSEGEKKPAECLGFPPPHFCKKRRNKKTKA